MNGLLPALAFQANAETLSDVEFTLLDVQQTLQALPRSAAAGPDQLPPILLKECADCLTPTLHQLFRRSLDSATLPQAWKHAVVTPIHKKGDRKLATNYRPISLTSAVCKSMERLVANAIFAFARRTGIIPEYQHGFVPGRSVTSNLLLCLEDWTKALDQGKQMDVIYLDFAKAFDKVPPRRLIHKLHHLGIRGKLLAWIEEYMTERTFQVRIGGTLSAVHPAKSGVPQGSVLGPLLFLLYASDLHLHTQSAHQAFADDNKLYGDPASGLLQHDLDHLAAWTIDWLIPLNPLKCTVLHLGGNKAQRTYHLLGHQLTAVTSQTDLGIIMSDDLKWGLQTNAVVKKVNSLLYMVRRAFSDFTPELLRAILVTYVFPILEYGVTSWSPYFQKDIALLEQVLRRATKLPRSLRDLQYEERLRRLGLESLGERRSDLDLFETFRILNGLYDVPALDGLFERARAHNTRGHSQKLRPGRSRRPLRKNFFAVRVVNRWNSLPEHAVSAPSLSAFKHAVQQL